jgi:hypothetical protein
MCFGIAILLGKTAARRRFGVAGQCSQVFINLIRVNLLGQLAKVNYKQRDAADVII